MKLSNSQRTELKRLLRQSEAFRAAPGEKNPSAMTTAELLAAARHYNVEIPADEPAKSPQDVFSPLAAEPAEPMAVAETKAVAPAAPDPDAVSSTVRDVLAPLGEGDFSAFKRKVEELAGLAHKPAQTVEVVKEVEVERVVERVVHVHAAPEGCEPHHLPKVVGEKRARDLFGLGGRAGDKRIQLWDAPDAPPVDPAYEWPACTWAVLTQLARKRNPFLNGPAGTGKTSFGEQLAAVTRRPFARIGCTDQTDAAVLVGMTTPKGWRDGILSMAIRRPGTIVLIDEPSVARPGALFVFQSVLDGARAIYVEETGERIPVADGVSFLVCDNTAGHGDDTGAYEGTRRMNYATLDRMGISVAFDYLPAAKEAAVLVAKTGCTRPLADALVAFATATRQDTANGRLTRGVGIRRLLSWAELLTDGIKPEEAFGYAVLNHAAPDDREVIRQLYTAHCDPVQLAKLAVAS